MYMYIYMYIYIYIYRERDIDIHIYIYISDARGPESHYGDWLYIRPCQDLGARSGGGFREGLL